MTDIQTENGAIIDALDNYSTPTEILHDDNVIVHLVGDQQITTSLHTGLYPRTTSGNHNVDDPASLFDLVTQIKGDNNAGVVTFCERSRMKVTTVLNDHQAAHYDHRDHRITYELKPTPVWAAWQREDRKMMGQEAFAEFIENNMPSIIEPPAADMLEIAQTFAAAGTIEFRGAKRLTSGVTQMMYAEELSASGGGNGQLDIPAHFHLRLTPYVGGQSTEVVVRFRYRLRDGKVALGFIIDDPVGIADKAFTEATELIGSAAEWLVVSGSPDAA